MWMFDTPFLSSSNFWHLACFFDAFAFCLRSRVACRVFAPCRLYSSGLLCSFEPLEDWWLYFLRGFGYRLVVINVYVVRGSFSARMGEVYCPSATRSNHWTEGAL